MAILLLPVDHKPETCPERVRQGPPNWPKAPAGTGEMPEFPERAPERKDDLFLAFVDSLLMPLSLLRTYVRSISQMPDLEELGQPVMEETRMTVLSRIQTFHSMVEPGRTYCEGADLLLLRAAIIGLGERGVPRGLLPPQARDLISDLEESDRPTGVDIDFRYRPKNPEHLAYWKTLESWTFARVLWDDLSAWISDPASYEGELAFTECVEQNAVAAALAILYAMDPRLSPERERCRFMPSVFEAPLDDEPREQEPDQPPKPPIDPTTFDFPAADGPR